MASSIDLLPEESQKREKIKKEIKKKEAPKLHLPEKEPSLKKKRFSFLQRLFRKKESARKELILPLQKKLSELKISQEIKKNSFSEKESFWKKFFNKKEKKIEEKHNKKELEVTFLPEEKKIKGKKQIIFSFLFLMIILFLTGGAYFFLDEDQKKKSAKIKIVQDKIDLINKETVIKFGEIKKAQELQKKLQFARNLLDNHPYGSQFLDFLEKNTVPYVYYTGLTVTSQGKISLSASTRDYRALAEQIVVFESMSDIISDLTVSGVSAQTDSAGKIVKINFDARLSLNPQVFLKK